MTVNHVSTPARPPADDGGAGPRRLGALLTRTLDRASDLGVVALALWTALYHLALAVPAPSDALLIVWLAMVAAVVVVGARRLIHPAGADTTAGSDVGADTTAGSDAGADTTAGSDVGEAATAGSDAGADTTASRRGIRLRPVAAVIAGTAAVASAVLVSLPGRPLFWVGWGLAAVVVTAVLAWLVMARAVPVAASGPVPAPWPAVLGALGLAAVSLYTFYIDTDDAFYVNKASWVAERGTIPTRDTLYTDQELGHLAGAGVPVQSIESLYGALAHAVNLSAPTVVYMFAPPVVAAAAIWALWRLVRQWAPRRANLAFIVACAYVAVSLLGSWTMLRLWMGKAAFMALLLPLVYLYLTRWAAQRRRSDAALLLASGAAAVGLTSSATILVVVLTGVVAGVLLLRRELIAAAGALLLLAYPLLTGIVVSVLSPPSDPGGPFLVGPAAFGVTYGTGVVAGIGWAGLLGAALLARPGTARLVAVAAAVATVTVLLPLVPLTIDDMTSAGAILYRLGWLAPVPAMVGLAATVALPRLPHRTTWLAAAPAAGLVVALLVGGTAYWDRVPWQAPPAWKVDQQSLREARAIAALKPGPGPVLAPRTTMTAIGVTTTRIHAVSPNASYVHHRAIPEDPAAGAARLVLHRLMYGHPSQADRAAAPDALRRLGVSMVCLQPTQRAARAVAERAGYTVPAGPAGDLGCLSRSSPG